MNARELGLKELFGLKPEQELFQGNYRAKMDELRSKGLAPWSTENVMGARNEVPAEHLRWHYSFDTNFGIIGRDQVIYLVPHSKRLSQISTLTKLLNGGLPFVQDKAIKTYHRVELILNKDFTEEEARKSPVWLNFAGNDQTRLDKYVESTFRFGKDKFKYDKMMGIFVPEDNIERAVTIDRL